MSVSGPIGSPLDDAVSTTQTTAPATVIGLLKGVFNRLLNGILTVKIDQTTPGTTDSVTVKSQGYAASVSLTRTADNNAYAANDVIGTGTDAGNAVLTFAGIGPTAGGKVLITQMSLEVQAAAQPSGMGAFRLWLFNATPSSNLADNEAFTLAATDTDELVGYLEVSTPVDEGAGLYVRGEQSLIVTVPPGGALYGYLQTRGAYTPSSATVKKIGLAAIGV